MSQSIKSALPHISKEDFLSHGVNDVLLEVALDCSICREPLAAILERESFNQPGLPSSAVLSIGHTVVSDSNNGVLQNSSNNSATAKSTDDSVKPEQAVLILQCKHVFGRNCLETWFTTSTSNRCPECAQELFPPKRMKLFLRSPTHAMRLEFANYIEQVCGDSETAAQIRVRLMSDWTRSLIREFAMELWRQEGYDVEYQYIYSAEEEEDVEEEDVEKEETRDEGTREDEETRSEYINEYEKTS